MLECSNCGCDIHDGATVYDVPGFGTVCADCISDWSRDYVEDEDDMGTLDIMVDEAIDRWSWLE